MNKQDIERKYLAPRVGVGLSAEYTHRDRWTLSIHPARVLFILIPLKIQKKGKSFAVVFVGRE